MILRIVSTVLGVVLVGAGLVLSPAPWLALLFLGACMGAYGLLTDPMGGNVNEPA